MSSKSLNVAQNIRLLPLIFMENEVSSKLLKFDSKYKAIAFDF